MSDKEYAETVTNRWIESVQRLESKPKKKAIQDIKNVIRIIINGGPLPKTEGEEQRTEGEEGVETPPQAPTVTTTTNPTNPRVLENKPRTHLKETKADTPGSTPPITAVNDRRRRSTKLNPQDAQIHSAELDSARIPIHHQNIIMQADVDAITVNVYYNDNSYALTQRKYVQGEKETSADHDIEYFCAPVVHPEMGETITSYKKLANDLRMSITWTTGFEKEFENLSQGDNKTSTSGMNALHVMDLEDIRNILKDCVVTYARIVVDFRPQKIPK